MCRRRKRSSCQLRFSIASRALLSKPHEAVPRSLLPIESEGVDRRNAASRPASGRRIERRLGLERFEAAEQLLGGKQCGGDTAQIPLEPSMGGRKIRGPAPIRGVIDR